MYALEITPEFSAQAEPLHPKRYKQIHLRVFALQKNPLPPDAELLDQQTYRLRVGPYRITYQIDDAQRRVRFLLLEELEEED